MADLELYRRPDGLVQAWLAGRNLLTRAAYAHDLAAFAEWAGRTEREAVAELLAGGAGHANAAVLAWRAAMLDAKLASASVNRRLSAVRSLCKLARLVGVIDWCVEVPSLRTTKYRDTRGPPLDTVADMVAAASGTRPEDRRNLAVLLLLFDMGLRRGEVVSLDVADIESGRDRLPVRLRLMGKGKREHEWLTVPPEPAAALAAWLDVRGDDDGPLFTALDRRSRGVRLTGRSVARIVGQLAPGVRPHGLRHASITSALGLFDVRTVRRFSRHADVRTVCLYDDARVDLTAEVARGVAGARRTARARPGA